MAFSQVIEDKNSPTGKSLVRLSGATDAGSAAAMAVAQEAKQTADAALPKAGGEMTGPVSNLKIGGVLDADLYDASAVTMKAMKDYAPMNLAMTSMIHVGGDNASDTADLNAGRGLSADKPFASLTGALLWAVMNTVRFTNLTLMIHSDLVYDYSGQIWNPNIGRIQLISSDTNQHIITLQQPIELVCGNLTFEYNLKLVSSGVSNFFYINGLMGACRLTIGEGVELSGEVTESIRVANGGVCVVAGNMTGVVTGKKYSCTTGGMIIGASKIPGTEAGTCDANSKAFG